MFENILVAVDGSPHANKALQLSIDLIKLYDCNLTIAHVVTGTQQHDLRHLTEVEHLLKQEDLGLIKSLDPEIPGILEDLRTNQYLEKVAEAWGQKVLHDAEYLLKTQGVEKYQTRLLDGNPAEALLDFVTSEAIDLVVIGSRGYGPIRAAFLGSISSKLNQLVSCTCITVK